MKSIKLKFAIDLRNNKIDRFFQMYGPGFHRFLPNNRYDKIEQKLTTLNGKISFWFEQRGKLDDKFIKYDNKTKLVEKDIIPTQGVLDGGPLYGEILVIDVSDEIVKALTLNLIENSDYISFGKIIVREIREHSAILIKILKSLFKQYWIGELEIWDSRNTSLGSFCKWSLSLKYSLNNGKTWAEFIPNAESHIVNLESHISFDYSDYISKDDWITIKRLYKDSYETSIASAFLSQAHETCENEDFKKAFIEAVTALEIALEHRINGNPELTESIMDSIKSFKSLPLKSQFGIFALECNNLNSSDIESSIEAINIRNKIVHEGYKPIKSESHILYSLLKSVSQIINEPVTKFPSNKGGNAIQSVEGWEKANKKDKKN